MSQITQIKLVMIFLGAVLVWRGYQEYELARRASALPQDVELARIEQEGAPSNPHLAIGPHWSMYQELVYGYNEKTNPDGPSDRTKVQYAYYPILSHEHPAVSGMRARDPSGEPEGAARALVDDFAVLVKTLRFERVGDLPHTWAESGSIRGLVVTRVDAFDRAEAAQLRESFPKLDPSALIVFAEDREPTSRGTILAMLGGGTLGVLAGLGWLVASWAHETQATPAWQTTSGAGSL